MPCLTYNNNNSVIIVPVMKRQKKSNNIFNKPILPESLFYEEVQKDYKVGGVKVEGCWLKGSPPQLYQSSIKSALELSELKAQLDQIKKSSGQSPADLFRMAQLRKRMENFQIIASSPTKKKFREEDLQIHADNLTLQKRNDFWGGVFQRKCKIEGKRLIVQSEKDKKQIPIDISQYSFELEEKEKGKTNEQSQPFVWPDKQHLRLFCWGHNLRPYCLYGEEKVLKNIVKNIKIELIELTQVDFFKTLSKQYEQKVLILFGNKLRIYEHLLKEKQKNNLNIAYDLIERSHILDEASEEPKKSPDRIGSFLDDSFHNSESSNKNSKNSLSKSISSPISSPVLSPTRSPISSQSQFRIRARRSTIHYDDLDNQEQTKEYKIEDFTLEIKQVAHSDSDEEIEASKISKQKNEVYLQNTSELGKRRNMESKKFVEEVAIPEFMNEDSFSEQSSIAMNKRGRVKREYRDSNAQFELKEYEFTHYVYLAYFEDFCACSQCQLNIVFYQRVLPQFEYQNMKTPVCVQQKIVFKRVKSQPRLYLPDKETIVKVSEHAQDMWVLLDINTSELKQKLHINLSRVLYGVDQSELLYLKNEGMIVCAGKLKIIASPDRIIPSEHIEESTNQFLEKYLIHESYTRQNKYKFIDYKKRNQELCQEWNNRMMSKIINKADEQQFLKSIFYGFPDKVFQKISNSFKNMKSLTRSETRIESSASYFSTQAYALIEGEIVKMRAYDLRVFIKIDKLVDFIALSKKNQYLQKRLDEICTFFTFKYGRASVEKLMSVYVIETLRKLETLLLQLKNSKQIEAFLLQYFQVQYEIDDLMKNVSSYFN